MLKVEPWAREKKGFWSEEGESWRQKLRGPSGKYSDRVLNQETEKKFWQEYLTSKPKYSPDPYSIKIAEAVCSIFKDAKVESLLELGPGWGNYTILLAEVCQQLICADASQAVLDYIQKIAEEHNLKNITTLWGEWEECNSPQYDGVFAYNCFYRTRAIEDFLMKIHEAGKKVCVIGMNSSPEQPYFHDFEQKLGLKVQYTRVDSQDLKRVLRSLGIVPNIEISLPNEREYVYDTFEELRAGACSKIIGAYDEQAVREILHHYYPYQEGKYRCIHQFTSELICWYK